MTEEKKSQLRLGAVATVVLLSGIILVSLPFAAFSWTQKPFTGIFFDPNLVVNDSGDPTWESRRGDDPINYPDRVVAVDGTAVSSVGDLQQELANDGPNDMVTLTLAQPPPNSNIASRFDEPERNKTISLMSINLLALSEYFWFFYLTAWILLILGGWVFWVRPYTESAQIFALFMAFAALGVGLIFDTRTTQYFVRIWIFSLSVLSGLSVLLAAIFPVEGRWIVKFRHLKWLVFVPGIIAGIWAQIILYDSSNPWGYVAGWNILFLLIGLGLLASLMLMAYRAVRSPSPLIRQQARIILIGGLIGYTPLILYFIATFRGLDTAWVPQAFFIPLIVLYPLSISYTIVRYRLLDTDQVMRRGLTYAILMAVLIGAFAVVVLSLTVVFDSVIDFNNPLVLAIFIVTAVLIFEPLRRRLQTSVDELFFKQPVARDKMLRDYNRELTTAVTEAQVASMMLLYVRTGIPEANPDLYLPNGAMSSYSSYYRSNDLVLGVDSALPTHMKKVQGAIDLSEARTWPEVFQQEKEAIDIMQTAVVVPMNNEEELLGWLSLSAKEDGKTFNQAELSYLTSLADQSLIGFERASVVRRLESRVHEQDLLSQFSQALNFTIELDDMLELVFVNYQRMFDIDDFVIYLIDPDIDQIYTAFYLENGERISEKEDKRRPVTESSILETLESGQYTTGVDATECTWITVPLNAGPATLGVIHAFYREPGVTLNDRQVQMFNILADQTATALARLETNRQLETRAHQLEIINEVTFSLATTMDLAILLELILDKAIQLLDTEAGTFMITDLDTGELEFRVARGPASKGLIGKKLPVGTGLAGTAAQTGQPIIVNKVHEDKRWFAQVEENTEFATESILTVPLLRHNTVWGVVQLINKRNEAPFDEEDQSLLTTFASQAVVAMENARLLAQTDEALQKTVQELSLLTQLDRDLNTSLDLTHVLNLALDRTLSICNGSAGAIVLVDAEGDPYRMITRNYETSFANSVVTAELGLVSHVLETKKPYISNNVHEEEGYIPANYDTHSQMTLPLTSKQELVGIVVIESSELEAFDEEAAETAVRVTNHTSVAIANALLVEQVNEANHAKSEFVSMVSHELKTPMTSMRGYTDLLLSGMTGELSEQQKGFLETISLNIRRMNQQIQDLTDISRIETGKLHVNIASISIIEVVNETLQIIQGLADEKDIRLHLQLPEDLPMVLADKDRIAQVMTNLLSNACKYSPPNTDVELCFETKMMPNGSSETVMPMVICSVRDHGYGISEEDLQKLFTKFFRSEDPNIRQAKGTGLGLSITKGIIELHKGEIWVESTVGEGTTFAFSVPQAQS